MFVLCIYPQLVMSLNKLFRTLLSKHLEFGGVTDLFYDYDFASQKLFMWIAFVPVVLRARHWHQSTKVVLIPGLSGIRILYSTWIHKMAIFERRHLV